MVKAAQWVVQGAHYPTASVVVVEVMLVPLVRLASVARATLRLVVAVAVAVAVQPSPSSSLWPSWVEEAEEVVAVAVQARPRPQPRPRRAWHQPQKRLKPSWRRGGYPG